MKRPLSPHQGDDGYLGRPSDPVIRPHLVRLPEREPAPAVETPREVVDRLRRDLSALLPFRRRVERRIAVYEDGPLHLADRAHDDLDAIRNRETQIGTEIIRAINACRRGHTMSHDRMSQGRMSQDRMSQDRMSQDRAKAKAEQIRREARAAFEAECAVFEGATNEALHLYRSALSFADAVERGEVEP